MQKCETNLMYYDLNIHLILLKLWLYLFITKQKLEGRNKAPNGKIFRFLQHICSIDAAKTTYSLSFHNVPNLLSRIDSIHRCTQFRVNWKNIDKF
jgi:hypothetical protein